MKALFFIIGLLLSVMTMAENIPIYKGRKHSLINWEEITPKSWLDFSLWKSERKFKDETPAWKRNLLETTESEHIGYIVQCVGSCWHYRGEGYSKGDAQSKVFERDVIQTGKDSAMWVLLIDGSLVRIFPESSITFRELNVTPKGFFVYSRVNFGQVSWLSRSNGEFVESDLRDTDPRFSPIGDFELGLRLPRKKFDESRDLIDQSRETPEMAKIKKVNELIKKNNEIFGKKESKMLILTRNGTIESNNFSGSIIVLLGGHTYIKSYREKSFNLKSLKESNLKFRFRGFGNRNEQDLEHGKWYQVGVMGREVSEYLDSNSFRVSEYITSSIPSVIYAREKLLKQKYKDFYTLKELSDETLSQKFGYRLWDAFGAEKSDSDQRLNFLLEYTRRQETSGLRQERRMYDRLIARGEALPDNTYGNRFYKKDLHSYIIKKEKDNIEHPEFELLNSTKRVFWEKINAR